MVSLVKNIIPVVSWRVIGCSACHGPPHEEPDVMLCLWIIGCNKALLGVPFTGIVPAHPY